ncbi:mucin-16-like [Stegostoma tigrinum]|uniref:mucin-16-like n=1 Tax=Stegostoma tigrinum TaxID=3053191 RepID=UPI002870219E|nr:mucin-16-like [Stegostoma tigrinum]
MIATALTTRESSSAETTSTSVQISTNFPVTSSAATVTTSETSTTNTTHIMTVESPIVPETDKPIQTQTKKFNVTFIVLSLPFTPVLQNLTSPLYLAESRNIIEKLNNLYANSTVNSKFLDCQPLSFRSANDGNSTVEAFCNFMSANGQQVDEVQLYHEFQDNTKGITSLGNYSLDSNSLYVDGYHESSVLTTTTSAVTTTQTPNLGQKRIKFNVTFIITNLQFIQSLQDSGSLLFNSTSNDVSRQLTALFNESKINETFSDCKVVSFSLANGGSTSVYAICTFKNDSTAQEIDKVTVYHEFRDNTKNISTLRTYSLDNNSLYVNGYHESTPFPTVTTAVATTQTPHVAEKPIEFNITFIITNLEFTENLQDSNSSLHNSTSDIIAHQLTTLFNKSKINETFLHCKVVSFSVADVANTSVYSICTFRNDSTQDFDRVTVYHEFRDNTNNISTLGIYSLDTNSLYVNGYHESPSLPTIAPVVTTSQTPSLEERPIEFNVTFIITDLEFTQNLQDSSSLLFISASDIISHQLIAVFRKSKINATFLDCKVVSFSVADVANTSVYSICTFRNDSTQDFDRVTVYHEFRDNTNNISTLGIYSLDTNSLYVNGYHEATPLPTIAPVVTTSQTPSLEERPIEFNVTFTITDLEFTQNLQDSSSLLFISASDIISHQLTAVFRKSKINATFLDCKVVSFSVADVANTSVYSICTFRNDSTQDFDRVTVYHEFRDNTNNISTLGIYSLDTNSLYVNGYHEATLLPTIAPVVTTSQTPSLEERPIEFNVTFIITDLEFTQSLQDSSSLLFISASDIISHQLIAVFRKSKINATFLDCKVVSFSVADVANTSVYSICTFRNDSTQDFDRVTVYHEFRDNTNNISTLGIYSLDTNSLYVNGYHEATPLPTLPTALTTTQIPNIAEMPSEFNVTFIITNLEFTQSLQDSNSLLYSSVSDIISHQLTALFNRSKINATFSHCKVASFSLANIGNTSVYAICSFRNDSTAQETDKVTVYHEFRDNTKNISTLGMYSLDNNSLYVNGYHEPIPLPTTTPAMTTTQTPSLEEQFIEFNVTFVITNLEFTQPLQDSSSLLFKSASNIISHQLTELYGKSKIYSTFLTCETISFRPTNIGSTSVYSVCKFRNESTPGKVDKVIAYNVFRNNTKNISILGAYSLDNNSLYINGYHETTPLPTPFVTTTPNPQPESFDFNVTFIITNLVPTANLISSNTALHESASSIINFQLNNLFKNSNINGTFSSCKVQSFSPANAASTSVYTICTFTNDSNPQDVNKVVAYHEIRENTKDISTLGAYSLDSNSLYVNGYHEEAPSAPPSVTTTPNLQPQSFDFNVTFIITNLPPTANLISPNSALHKSASNIIAYQLNNLFRNSNISKTFSSCKVQSFSPANAASTSVYTICTFTNDSNPQDVNRVVAYHEIRGNTKDISTLGAYSLDSNSLYVNGYHEETPSTTPFVATTPNLQTNPFEFNVTFIITNLVPTPNLIFSNSALHRSASNIIAYQLDNLFTNSNIKKTFSSCKVQSFSPTNAASTSVYTICTFTNDSNPQEVNRVSAYREIRDNTKDISTLGAYSLDSNSLYVNGYHEAAPSAPPFVATTPNLQPKSFDFNVTFTITNLVPTTNLISSNSALHKSASNIIAYQLNDLFRNSNINKTFSSCKVQSFSPANAARTSVYTTCTFTNDSNPQDVNRVVAFHEIRDNTKDISTLGAYSLDSNSLYVNGYHEVAPSAPPLVATTPNLETKPFDFNVTFTVTNLPPTANLISSNSALYKSASNIITYQLNNLFTNSNINKTFSSCKVQSFSPTNTGTSVSANCTFRNDSNPQEVNRIMMYHLIRDNTKEISTLGAYSLDSDSLYVNDYHESTPLITEAPVEVVTLLPNKEIKPIDINVTFIINNLEFRSELQNINSAEYTTTSNNVVSLLNNLYKSSKVNETFTNCELVSFSSANQGNTKVEAHCSFKNNPTIPRVDKVTVYNEFRDNTEKITALGIYALDKDSLYVDGYHELEPTTAPTILSPEVREGDLPFELNFTIINRNFTEALNDPNSLEYQSIVANVTRMLENLYKNSALKDSYRICKVTGLRIGSVKCICTCYFDASAVNEPVIAEQVKAEFTKGTNSTNLLGNVYQLRNTSLAVEAKAPVSSDRTEIPYWAIILIVLGILLLLVLLFLLCLFITLCLKKKFHGSYNMMQNPAGLYFPHQKFY